MSKFGERAAKMKKDRAEAQALAEGKKTETPAATDPPRENLVPESSEVKKQPDTLPAEPEALSEPKTEEISRKNEPKKKKKRAPRKSEAKKAPRKKAAAADEDLIMVGIRMSRQEKSRLKAAAALADTSIQEMVRAWIKNLKI